MVQCRAHFVMDFFSQEHREAQEEKKLVYPCLALSHDYSFSVIFPRIFVMTLNNTRRVLPFVHIHTHTRSHVRDFWGSKLGKTTAAFTGMFSVCEVSSSTTNAVTFGLGERQAICTNSLGQAFLSISQGEE